MPTSMILRFRDLAGPIGSTIERHRVIAEDGQGVWWAWWSKPNEHVPREFFAQLKGRIAAAGHAEVFLADSGRYLFYRARLVEIKEAPTEDPIGSPNPDRTPEYYRTTPYKAWFRFASIEQIGEPLVEEVVRKWSYDEIHGFTDDPFISSYQDKRIFSLQEVINRRHRTIYFIQPYKAGHATHLVEALPPVQPSDFITTPIVGRSSCLLHISDLHFGPHHRFADKEGVPGKRTLARLLIDDLRTQVKADIAGVIVTGDITWQGEETEFQAAREFFDRLKSEFALEAYHFVIMPGNHDIRWADDVADKKQPVVFPSDTAKANYRSFMTTWYGLPPKQWLAQGRRFLLGNFVTVDVVGVSSSELEQKHLAGYGYVRSEQLQAAMQQMGWTEGGPRTTYRILGLHHHLLPVLPEEELDSYEKNFSLTLDAGHVLHEALANGVDLVVHGHQHHPFTAAFMRARGEKFGPQTSLVVNAAGSAGVRKEDIPSGLNSYALYEFDADVVRVRVRRLGDVGIGFAEAPELGCELRRNSFGGLLINKVK